MFTAANISKTTSGMFTAANVIVKSVALPSLLLISQEITGTMLAAANVTAKLLGIYPLLLMPQYNYWGYIHCC